MPQRKPPFPPFSSTLPTQVDLKQRVKGSTNSRGYVPFLLLLSPLLFEPVSQRSLLPNIPNEFKNFLLFRTNHKPPYSFLSIADNFLCTELTCRSFPSPTLSNKLDSKTNKNRNDSSTSLPSSAILSYSPTSFPHSLTNLFNFHWCPSPTSTSNGIHRSSTL